MQAPKRPYVVRWLIEVDAESAVEAAALARIIQRDPDSQAGHFAVIDPHTMSTSFVDLDLGTVEVRE